AGFRQQPHGPTPYPAFTHDRGRDSIAPSLVAQETEKPPMAYEQILYEVQDRILTITLNRPDKLNAFTGKMQQELIDAFDQADKDDDIRCIIITGAGRGFCAGADLSSGGSTFDRAARGRTAPTKPN